MAESALPPPPRTLRHPLYDFHSLHSPLRPTLNTRITKSFGLNGGGGGGGAVLSTLIKNSWCGQSSKGLRGQTNLGVCWVNRQAKVEQISSNLVLKYSLNITVWAYNPLVLAPAEGMKGHFDHLPSGGNLLWTFFFTQYW